MTRAKIELSAAVEAVNARLRREEEFRVAGSFSGGKELRCRSRITVEGSRVLYYEVWREGLLIAGSPLLPDAVSAYNAA